MSYQKIGVINMANVIKRNSKTVIFTAVRDSNVWKAGDTIKAEKRDGKWEGSNNRTLEKFQLFWSHMHNEDLLKLDLQWDYI